MATPYRPIAAPNATNPIGFNNTSDARKVTQNQRQIVQGQGDALMSQDQDLANQYRDQSQGVENYLDPIQSNLAEGNGGYNAQESAAINYSPEQQQNLVTQAGVSAGTNTAASVGAAGRAANAAGGSPMALAAYRARAAQQEGAQAGDAMTAARVAGHNAAAQGATTTGNARLGQQSEGLGYYGNLQAQKNQNAQNEQGLQQGAYGTQTAGTGAATNDVLKASQTPTKMDKAIGLAAGAASAFLADGTSGYLDSDGMDAVVGEDGPEAIIEAIPRPKGSRVYLADGFDGGSGEVPEWNGIGPSGQTQNGDDPTKTGWMQKLSGGLQNYLAGAKQQKQPGGQQDSASQWNPTTPYQQAGQAIGSAGKAIGSAFLADGCNYRGRRMMADGIAMDGIAPPQAPQIVTSPTKVHLDPGDKVVPLTYRPKTKVRPSIAVKAWMPRKQYGAHGA